MTNEMLEAEFLDELKQRAEVSFGDRLHQAFIAWYVEAEYGNPAWKFTDDAKDGGIDAVVWHPDEVPPVSVIQSKFTAKLGGDCLGSPVYKDFERVVMAFRHKGDDFEEFLASVRDDLRQTYRKAFEGLVDLHWAQAKKAFRLITTHRRRPSAEFDLVPEQNFVCSMEIARLYEQYRRVWTPKARPLELWVPDKLPYRDPIRGVTSYLLNVRVSDFRKYLDRNDVARLVARNIRYDLGGRVGRAIRGTYEKSPHDFWYLHNGLTIICDKYSEENQIATLMNPSVVNGAQSLYAIAGAAGKPSSALVITRVIVRGTDQHGTADDDAWLQGVIRGVNTQNRVREYDLRSNEPEQVELQRRFREHRVFFERKRGEWRDSRNEPKYRSFERLSLQVLGQIVAAIHDEEGQGVLLVKRGTEKIFEEKTYRKLFPSRTKVGRRFRRFYLAYRVYKLLNKFGYKSMTEYRKQRHAFWNTLWLLHKGLTSADRSQASMSLESVKAAFDEFEKTGTVGRLARKTVKETTKHVWATWRHARRQDPERWTPNNFFKTKFGNKMLLKIAFPKLRADLQRLGQCMVN